MQLSTAEKTRLQKEARLVVDLLQNYHFTGRSFREIENMEMITRYLAELDPAKDFFSDEDAVFLQRRYGRSFKSVYLFRGDLQPAFEIFALFNERAQARLGWVQDRLERPFEFETDETYRTASIPDSPASAKSDAEWERRLKSEVLAWVVAGRDEADARRALAKYYSESSRQIRAMDSYAIRERFFDAIIRSFDPHSGYFSADSSKEFAQQMENAEVGIGLDLRKENGLCVVNKVEPGSPADLGSPLESGDMVESIAIDGGAPFFTEGKRMRDVVAALQAKAGSTVTLQYRLNGSGESKHVSLEARRIPSVSTRAYGAVSTVPRQPHESTARIGWIVLDSFYTGGEKENLTSATRDVRELMEKMGTATLDGIVIDLRNNPGGALTEAMDLSALFLDAGVIMQTRGADGKIEAHEITPQKAFYAGPLTVLVSHRSASASEIFAAAMRFHQRGLVVGDAATFGKGSVQNYIELARSPIAGAGTEQDWGTLRLTYQRFYQPDGTAVQRNGIAADIPFPSEAASGSFAREETLPHALPADNLTLTTPPVGPDRVALSEAILRELKTLAAANFSTLSEWQLWKDEQASAAAQSARTERPLQMTAAANDWEKLKAERLALTLRRRALSNSEAFPTIPFETGFVRAALDERQKKLREIASTAPLVGHLQRNTFTLESPQKRLRQIPLAQFHFNGFANDTRALADAFARTAGIDCPEEAMQKLLTQLALVEEKTATGLAATAIDIFSPSLGEEQARRGLEAIIATMIQLDTEFARERPGLDIQVREAMRLTARWAALVDESAPAASVESTR